MSDPHAELAERIWLRVVHGPGESPQALRQAVSERAGVPPELRSLIDKIHQHAYRVTDAEVAQAQAAYGDDPLFELILSASLGASRQRLLAGLAALSQA